MITKHMIKFSDMNDRYLNIPIHVRIGDSKNVYTNVFKTKRLDCDFLYNGTLYDQSSYDHISKYTYDNPPFSKMFHGAFNHFSEYTERYKAFRHIDGRCFLR